MARLIAYCRRRGDGGVHRDRRPRRQRRDGRGRPDGGPASRGRVHRRVHLDPGPPGRTGRHPLPTRHGQRVALQVSVAATTLLGMDDAPATSAPTGRSPLRWPASSPRTPPGGACSRIRPPARSTPSAPRPTGPART